MWEVKVFATTDRLVVQAAKLAARPAGRDYELWALPQGGNPVSVRCPAHRGNVEPRADRSSEGGVGEFESSSVEDAPWSAAINETDAYGYSIFDVDPGDRPGHTTITFQYFAIPAVSNEAGTAHDGTTTLPSTPTETFVFGRRVGRR